MGEVTNTITCRLLEGASPEKFEGMTEELFEAFDDVAVYYDRRHEPCQLYHVLVQGRSDYVEAMCDYTRRRLEGVATVIIGEPVKVV